MQLQQWDSSLSSEEMKFFSRELALTFARRINHDKELQRKIEVLIENQDYLSLCEFKPDFATLTHGDAEALVQVLALFSKRADLDLGIDKRLVAWKKFEASERRCRETNEIFRKWGSGLFLFETDVERVLFHAQRKIASTLGNVPLLSQLRCRFGPGATTQIPKRTASARSKLSQTFACSEEFVTGAAEYLSELPAWVPFTEDSDTAVIDLEIHTGQLHFVPKTAKTDRSIVVEPSLNSFFQLGVGDYIADRLRDRGIDISDQSRNQKLARSGSIDGGLATLDLSSASDLIASELVAHLLPIDWFLFLSQLRTGTVEYEGKTMKLQKFSSMGNGFTFPLETLIFWALASSCVEGSNAQEVSVYGDDIIVPTDAVPLVCRVLNAVGFVLNKDKSFWTGPFRESCGADYFSGLPIRPVFLKDRLTGESAFTLHNFFVRNDDPDAATVVLRYIDPSIRIYGPDGYGDGHLLGDFTAVPYGTRYPNAKGKQWCGYTFDTFTWQARKSYQALPGDYVYPSYSIYLREGSKDPLHDERAELLARLGSRVFRQCYGDEAFRSLVQALQGLRVESTPHSRRHDSFGVTLPGKRGYKRISIYTLTI